MSTVTTVFYISCTTWGLLKTSDDEIIYSRINDIAPSLLSVAGQDLKLIRMLTPALSHRIMMSLSMSLPLSRPAHLLEYLNCCLSNVLFLFVCMQLHNQLDFCREHTRIKTTFYFVKNKPSQSLKCTLSSQLTQNVLLPKTVLEHRLDFPS